MQDAIEFPRPEVGDTLVIVSALPLWQVHGRVNNDRFVLTAIENRRIAAYHGVTAKVAHVTKAGRLELAFDPRTKLKVYEFRTGPWQSIGEAEQEKGGRQRPDWIAVHPQSPRAVGATDLGERMAEKVNRAKERQKKKARDAFLSPKHLFSIQLRRDQLEALIAFVDATGNQSTDGPLADAIKELRFTIDGEA